MVVSLTITCDRLSIIATSMNVDDLELPLEVSKARGNPKIIHREWHGKRYYHGPDLMQ